MMLKNLQTYPVYKDSGVSWMGKVPEHWQIKRGKALFKSIDIRSDTGNEELLTVSSQHGVVPRRSASVTMFKAESYLGYKLCWPGDLVINSLWAWARGLGVSKYHGIVSSAYGVYRLRPDFKLYSGFIHEFVRSEPFNWELRVRSKGIWISRLQLTDDAFLGAPFLFPPPEEQSKIVRFLNHIDWRIQRYIRAKKKLIALLNEQKQLVINDAVTRGLNSNVRLKPSGIQWLSDVPEHWKVVRLKYVVRGITDGEHISPQLIDNGIPLLSAKDIRDKMISYDVDKSVSPSLAEQFWRRCCPRKDDLLIVSRGATIGRVAIVEDHRQFCLMGSVILCQHGEVESEYLYYALNADHAQTSLWFTSASSAQQAIYIKDVAELRLPIPPIDERKAIIKYLNESLSTLHRIIAKEEREIHLLREYRTRLIADVVTGKLNVQEASSNLPDESIEPEAFEATEVIDDLENILDLQQVETVTAEIADED